MDRWMAGQGSNGSLDATEVTVRFSLRMSFRFDVALHHMDI
jgi:hypothetical protein